MDDITVHDEPVKTDKRVRDAEAAARLKIRLDKEKETIERMYCPCPGFAYNALAGDKNILVSFPRCHQVRIHADGQCKHLLAALIGWKTGREIKTEVPQHGVVSLLDLHGQKDGVAIDAQVKTEDDG
jgi:hypothetical protein